MIPLPKGFTAGQALAIGIVGYTAMLCVMASQKHGVKQADGEVLVTGAAGGVGSFAIVLLSKLSFMVVASSGRPQEADCLHSLDAAEIIDRSQVSYWRVSVGPMLAQHPKSEGAVAACGLAQGMDFPGTVHPSSCVALHQ